MEKHSRKRIAVLGAGPAGMMAAITAAEHGASVVLYERNARVGRKLGISGKGRCNVTNAAPAAEFPAQIVSNPRFAYSALDAFSNEDTMRFFEQSGVPLKVERGGRVFPVSDKARDIVDAMFRHLKKSGVQLLTDTRVNTVKQDEEGLWRVEAGEKSSTFDAVIVALGGKSYSSTGSTGDGYKIAQSLGHTLIPLRAGLNGLETAEYWPKTLSGLALRNVGFKITADSSAVKGKKPVVEDFGEMLFTHFGVSGPMILSASSRLEAELLRRKTDWESAAFKIHIDLKPALEAEKLDERLCRDMEAYRARSMQNAMKDLLPERLIVPVLEQAHIACGHKAGDLTKQERRRLGEVLKDLTLTLKGPRPIEEAIVTMGGVKTSEVNPGSLESKLRPGLYFAGELLDLDALTGGYNLQLAFSTGYLAGLSAAEES